MCENLLCTTNVYSVLCVLIVFTDFFPFFIKLIVYCSN